MAREINREMLIKNADKRWQKDLKRKCILEGRSGVLIVRREGSASSDGKRNHGSW